MPKKFKLPSGLAAMMLNSTYGGFKTSIKPEDRIIDPTFRKGIKEISEGKLT